MSSSKQSNNISDTSDVLKLEAQSFDSQIEERVANGHIPDLRRATKCEWFYNNIWRDPEFARLDFGQIFERINQALLDDGKSSARVLEVGSGPGHICLELARAGHDVIGMDLSPKAIEIAQRFADDDPWKDERGSLTYFAGNFLTDLGIEESSFDAVVYVGALHHFPDQDSVGRRTQNLLKANGLVIAHEPTRDRVTRGHAALFHMVRQLLSVGDGYYEKFDIPRDSQQLHQSIASLYQDLRYEGEEGHKKQSPNDNEAGFAEMSAMLTSQFETVTMRDTYGFFHETIGGLRYSDEVNHQLARYLRDLDGYMVEQKFLPATEFFFVGRKPQD